MPLRDKLRARAFESAYAATLKRVEAEDRSPELSEADALTELVCDCISSWCADHWRVVDTQRQST